MDMIFTLEVVMVIDRVDKGTVAMLGFRGKERQEDKTRERERKILGFFVYKKEKRGKEVNWSKDKC